MIRFDIVTLFPEAFSGWSEHSILGRARKKNLADIRLHNLRDFAGNRHDRVDDRPFGGGGGMVLQAPPVLAQIRALGLAAGNPLLVMSASGEPWTDSMARQYAGTDRLAILCGHYEGIDQRAIDLLGGREISVGDFVLTGGELPAMCVVDSVVRLRPGVLGNDESLAAESHKEGLLEGPQYTRPEVVEGVSVPEVLLSGDHGRTARYRREESLRRTLERRPELLRAAAAAGRLSADDLRYLGALGFRP